MFRNSRYLKYTINVVFLLCILCLVSCGHVHVSMLSGENFSKQSNALIRVVNDDVLSIRSVDGEVTVNYFKRLFNNHRFANSVDVLPGKHELLLQYNWNSNYSHGNIIFFAERGREYVVKAKAVGYLIEYWIEDGRTGESVAIHE